MRNSRVTRSTLARQEPDSRPQSARSRLQSYPRDSSSSRRLDLAPDSYEVFVLPGPVIKSLVRFSAQHETPFESLVNHCRLSMSSREALLVRSALAAAVYRYLELLILQTGFAQGFAGDFNRALATDDRPAAFRYAQAIAAIGGTVSLLLWPSDDERKSTWRGFKKARGVLLRDVLEVPDHPTVGPWSHLYPFHTLRGRTMRNAFAHLDERFDSWICEGYLARSTTGGLPSSGAPPDAYMPGSYSSGVRGNDWLWFERREPFIFHICGEEVHLNDLVKSLHEVGIRAKHTFDSPTAIVDARMKLIGPQRPEQD